MNDTHRLNGNLICMLLVKSKADETLPWVAKKAYYGEGDDFSKHYYSDEMTLRTRETENRVTIIKKRTGGMVMLRQQ